MFDCATGWKVGVVRADPHGPYIIVSRDQLAAVCWLLAAHWVPHTVEAFVPELLHDTDPIEAVVRLDPRVDEGRVQEILDTAP